MKLETFTTEYDDSLSGDSFIDPLGQLVIWSAYGQQIFKNRVSSVSNDVRNYTLNLLHHGVIRSILLDETVKVPTALANEVGPKESLPFIHACLIHLENIFTFSMVDEPEKDGIDTLGILGGSKGRQSLLDWKNDPLLRFTDKPEGQLLIRQLGLGVSGRYKTPFVEMGFFDHSYRYFHHGAEACWSAFEHLLDTNSCLHQCFSKAKSHLVALIGAGQGKSQVPPECQLSDVPQNLKRAYRAAFATPGQVGSATKDFWLRVGGLDQGAAGALLKVLEDRHDRQAEDKLVPRKIVGDALNWCHDLGERQKLQNIQLVEPLLAEVDLLFCLARYKKIQSFREVRKHWEELGRSDSTLAERAAQINASPQAKDVLQGTGRSRLERLLALSSRETVEEQLQELLNHHALVMRERGQLRWVEFTKDEEVHVHGRTESLPSLDNRPPGSWVNSYYLHEFKNLVSGYQGGVW